MRQDHQRHLHDKEQAADLEFLIHRIRQHAADFIEGRTASEPHYGERFKPRRGAIPDAGGRGR